MLYAHRTFELARAAGGALERCFLGDVLAEQRRFAGRSQLVEVFAQAQDDLLGVQYLPRGIRGTVLGAAPALDARVGLQGVDARNVLSRIEAEILVARERRNAAEARAAQEHGDGAERQVQMLGVWNQGKESQQRERVQPPIRPPGRARPGQPQAEQVGDHEQEDQRRNHARFGRYRSQPLGPHRKTPHEQPGDRDGHHNRPHGHEIEIETAKAAGGIEKPDAEPAGDVVDGDRREGAKPPEDEGVRQSRQRPPANHLALRHHFPQELANARAQREEREIGGGARAADHAHDPPQAHPEQPNRGGHQGNQNRRFGPGCLGHGAPNRSVLNLA